MFLFQSLDKKRVYITIVLHIVLRQTDTYNTQTLCGISFTHSISAPTVTVVVVGAGQYTGFVKGNVYRDGDVISCLCVSYCLGLIMYTNTHQYTFYNILLLCVHLAAACQSRRVVLTTRRAQINVSAGRAGAKGYVKTTVL